MHWRFLPRISDWAGPGPAKFRIIVSMSGLGRGHPCHGSPNWCPWAKRIKRPLPRASSLFWRISGLAYICFQELPRIARRRNTTLSIYSQGIPSIRMRRPPGVYFSIVGTFYRRLSNIDCLCFDARPTNAISLLSQQSVDEAWAH